MGGNGGIGGWMGVRDVGGIGGWMGGRDEEDVLWMREGWKG